MPETIRPPRVGRVRLGEKTAKGYPKAVDYFRVDLDESGITSQPAVDSFHEVYGDTPRQLRIQIPGHTIEQVVDQAYRRYSAGGLQRQCEGPAGQCSAKSQSGAWTDQPCLCAAQGLDPNGEPHHKDACEFSFSFSFLLPDVSGLGIWDLSSGSTMSRDAIVGFLQMMLNLRGQIALLECDMLVVMKTGRAGALVPTVELRTHAGTPREMLEAAAAGTPLSPGAVPELSPGALDTPEPTIHQAGFTEAPPTSTAGAEARASRHGQREPDASGQPAVDTPSDEEYHLGILRDNMTAAMAFIAPPLNARLKAVCAYYDVQPSRDGIIAAWGHLAVDDHLDIEQLVSGIEAEINKDAQLGLDDAEPVTGEVVE
ncbi:MAG TPA: hypothetical protein VGQ45_03920 [Gaiellales bacterium]|jgi:hypothetical protein|nr:hypothetical protein [Gaiellales bacterium]